MWNKTLFLTVRVKIRRRKTEEGAEGPHDGQEEQTERPGRFGLFLPVALYVFNGFLLACEPILSLVLPRIPGSAGVQARAAVDAAQGVFDALTESEPQNFVHVDVQDSQSSVLVDVSTMGFREGNG